LQIRVGWVAPRNKSKIDHSTHLGNRLTYPFQQPTKKGGGLNGCTDMRIFLDQCQVICLCNCSHLPTLLASPFFMTLFHHPDVYVVFEHYCRGHPHGFQPQGIRPNPNL
jgi:hypothetical protein